MVPTLQDPGEASLADDPPGRAHVEQQRGSRPLGRTSLTMLGQTMSSAATQVTDAVTHGFTEAVSAVAGTASVGFAVNLDLGQGGQKDDYHDREEAEYHELVQQAIERANARHGVHHDELHLPKTAPGHVAADGKQKKADFEETQVVSLRDLHLPSAAMGRRLLLDHAMRTQDQDNSVLLRRVKERLDRVGLAFPEIEVRFSDLCVGARVHVGSSGRPNVLNFFKSKVEYLLSLAHIIKPDTRPFEVLHKCEGVLKPGRLTLLLGPPGSGKSTLLQCLAGVCTDGTDGMKVTGDITYNGEVLDSFQVRRTSAYVEQVDNHLAELSVRETFGFAKCYQGSGVMPALVEELTRREAAAGIKPDPVIAGYMKALAAENATNHMAVDTALRLLGLEVCADTRVGNAMMRGVSGGQRKRVTTGEFLVGPARVLLLDEISTGLDSSTTYLITDCLRNMAHNLGMTILVSLLQPPPEVYDLFDDIMVLSDGRIVYHGAREQVAPFFNSIGFSIPERKSEPDFLQEVTSRKDQGQYWTGGADWSRFMPVEEMAARFAASSEGAARKAELAVPPPAPPVKIVEEGKPDPSAGSSWPPDALVRSKYALKGLDALRANLKRETLLMTRMSFLWGFKTFQALFVGILFSTLFYYKTMDQETLNGGALYLAIIFYSITHSMFNGYVEMGILVGTLRVFFKQRNAMFFPSWSFTIPPVLLRIPFSIADGTMWSLLVYWITGMAPSPGRFFIFMVYMMLMSQMALALFRALAALARNYDIANSFGSTALIVLLILSGFIMAKDKIHPWWIWAYWLSPITYAQQALSINELGHPRWQSNYIVYRGNNMTVGHAVLESYNLYKDEYYVWLGVLVLLGYTALFQVAAFLFLKWFGEIGKEPPVVSEEYLAEREANIKGGATATATATATAGTTGTTTNGTTVNGSTPTSGTASHTSSTELTPTASSTSPVGDMVVHMGNGNSGGATAAHAASPLTATAKPPLAVTAVTAGKGAVVGDRPSRQIQAAERGMVLPFKPMAMSFNKICYSVNMPRDMEGYSALVAAGEAHPQLQLLTNITGTFRPGVLTALMGVSGAGKTTLMDVLAGRKNQGAIKGDIHVGGYPKEQATFARVCGYVEQSDIHSPRTTVREALLISGRLRLAGVDLATVQRFVDEVMALVELGPQREAIVGVPGVFGLSVEQRKRLTIGVELVANPSVVFMDEPTSGLDARAAAVVMRAVRNTVNTGRTVVCTIHQPSIDIFEAFDELLLLKRGGRTIYHGPLGERSKDLVAYFSAIPGVAPLPGGLNPATWMLDISTVSAETKLGKDFADLYDASPLSAAADRLASELAVPKQGDEPLSFSHFYARGLWEQFTVLLKRNVDQYWRNPTYNGVRYMFCTILGLLLGSIFWDTGMKRGTPVDVFNVMGALFLCITFLGTYNASGVLPILAIERPVFYRERAAGMYAAFPYALAQGLIEIPYVLVQSVLYGLITYYMIQFEFTSRKVCWYLLFVFLTLLFFAAFGMMIVSLMPVPELAGVLSAMFYSIWFVWGGFFISYPSMPVWWKWYYWLDPLSYALYGIIGSQLGDVDYETVDPGDGGAIKTVQQFLKDSLNFEYSFVWATALIMVGYIVLFFFVFMFAMQKFNFSHR